MNYNKRFILITIFLFIIFLSLPLQNCYSGSKLNQDIIKFVDDIYFNYTQQNFVFVYNKLYPGVKNILTEKNYVEFQKKNFEKYSLVITEYNVNEKVQNVSVPDEFSDYFAEKNNMNVKKINVAYHMSFINSGSKVKRDISKDVYIYVDKEESFYLLWNPQIIK